ncbi:hypothetical protein [Nocardia pneumoniae]|uniref:hypothetical protein n=1 Tax=Nocardia pneumoniae TaxID=228601 RepID=UPI0002DB51F7|nr:hypothetical protein [Nocardia pneumoniae]
MGPRKDIVIGAVARYEWAEVEPWARSLVAAGFDCVGVVIVYDRGRRGDVVVQNLESLGLHAVRMPLRGSVYNTRFEDIAHVLRTFAHSLRFAVVTDVRDVYFQADPVRWLESNLKKPFLAVSEAVRYRDEAWNRNNLQQSFPAHAERLRSKVVRNVGVLAGQAGMVADLCLAIALIAESAGVPVADQSAYNLLLDMEPYRSAVQLVASEDGFVCQGGTLGDPGRVRILRPFLLEPEPVLTTDGVRTSAGKLYPIVHQYDRVPEWNRALRSRLPSVPAVEVGDMVGSTPRNKLLHRERPGSGLPRILGDADGASILHVAHSIGVRRDSSSIQLYSPASEHSSLSEEPHARE